MAEDRQNLLEQVEKIQAEMAEASRKLKELNYVLFQVVHLMAETDPAFKQRW